MIASFVREYDLPLNPQKIQRNLISFDVSKELELTLTVSCRLARLQEKSYKWENLSVFVRE